ncbi:hypothetical protein SAMN05216302_1003123 [Nitrosomonas aestuarii]|uniref:Uncharacterized protein n=1 Tax=Nitrosomonas aestuarii TaxID=52441 RepID=A0A1I3YBS2_9PROT|nr:hypothetical protein [Nitrosomonas aestuarii]SFK29213.1 hypothetical protein SAMN05216302_1003123 [Nitrosomonas aestuarii]
MRQKVDHLTGGTANRLEMSNVDTFIGKLATNIRTQPEPHQPSNDIFKADFVVKIERGSIPDWLSV